MWWATTLGDAPCSLLAVFYYPTVSWRWSYSLISLYSDCTRVPCTHTLHNTTYPIHGFSPLQNNNNNLQLYRSAYCMPHERRLRNWFHFPLFLFSLFHPFSGKKRQWVLNIGGERFLNQKKKIRFLNQNWIQSTFSFYFLYTG